MKKLFFMILMIVFAACSSSNEVKQTQSAPLKAEIKTVDLKITELPEMIFAGYSVEIKNNQMELLDKAWMNLMKDFMKIKNAVKTSEMWGISYDYTMNGATMFFKYLAGIQISKTSALPKGMTDYKVAKQTYAVFPHKGKMDKIKITYEEIYKKLIPASGYNATNAPVLELYNQEFKINDEQSVMYIYIPVAKKTK